MTTLEYIRNLNRIKDLALGRWSNLTMLERDIIEGSYEWLVDNLEIKRGEIQVDPQLAASMDTFLNAVIEIVNNSQQFKGKIGSFLSDLQQIQKNNIAFHRTTNNFDIETAGVTNVQKAIVGEIINQYTDNGLNANFAAPLRDNIFRNILAGANMKDVKQVLNNYILSGEDKSGKLKSYLTQTAQQAVDSYSGAINQQLVKEFKFTGYVISGSLIETSSKQCVEAVDSSEAGYLTFKEWEKILQIARENPKARLIPGTTIENLPLNKLHWGCRHDFTPIIKNEPPKPQEKKKAEKKKTNEEVLQEIEDKIRVQKFESAAVVKDGKQLFFKDGEAAQVEFDEKEIKLMKDAIVTHNHPSGRSFSLADVRLFNAHGAEEIRAAAVYADYSLKNPGKPWDDVTIKNTYNRINQELMEKFTELINRGEMTIEDANQNHHHELMMIFAKELGFKYKRTLR